MEDTLLEKKCEHCGSNITLMESCRVEKDSNDGAYLVERCLSCGRHQTVEIVRLHEDQTDLNM